MVTENPSLLILSGVQGDSRRYRTFHLYEQARLAGLNCQLTHITDSHLRPKISGASVIILHRAAFDSQVAWIEKEIHRQGGILINDLDDLIFDPDTIQYIHSPDFADPVRRSLYLEDVHRFRQTLDVSDHVIVSSNYLLERVQQLGKTASIHRNAFSLEMLSLADTAEHMLEAKDGHIVIGYASGTPTHDQDFALIKPALVSILQHNPQVVLWLVGRLDPGKDWGSLEDRVKVIEFVPWRKLNAIQASFDINLAPLQIDNPFGQSKSEIKYIEAALLRVPTIASPSDAYRYAIQDGQNGYLKRSTMEWEACLAELLNNFVLRSVLGKHAYEDVLKHYYPTLRANQLVDTLNTICANRFRFQYLPPETDAESKPAGPFWSCAAFERTPTLLQRGVYTLKHRNIQTLLKQIWIFIRRFVSPLFPFPNPP
ncbi:MAG: hypothetical protein C3F13_17395 [Anaerolineales bacterium]|nr:glycosyltransferase family 4 protein [Anaerolineae bacterium]PWB50242.1 MAG: hypothetical protein C3F13_17395 [Anaerolineales bacterium]